MTDNTLGMIHVVDDEDSIRKSLDFLLRTAGYNVECWANGEEFLERADKSVPACVLLDIRMPGIDGLEVQAQMADHASDLPVIMVTGNGDIALAVRAMKAGALNFIEKPFDRDELLISVSAAFQVILNRLALREEQTKANLLIAKLTKREREVLDGLACGFPNKTIAYDLGLSSRTVEIYRARVMLKLEVNYFADALRVAFKAGLGSQKAWRANAR